MSNYRTFYSFLKLMAVFTACISVCPQEALAQTGSLAASASPRVAGNSSRQPTRESETKSGITVLGSAPTTVEEATLFSMDNISIPFTTNLVLTMEPVDKHQDNPLLRRGESGDPDEWGVQCYGSVIYHEGKYKLWYLALNEEDMRNMPNDVHYKGGQLAYAESEDGIDWEKPNLGLVEWNGNKNNNLLLMDPSTAHGLDCRVIYEPDDPDPARRFKMVFHMGARFDGRPAGAPIPFFSADGLRWKIAIDAKLENYTVASDETAIPPEHFEMGGLYKWNGMYHLMGQQVTPFMWLPDGTDCGRVLTTFRSPDFVNWSRTKTLSFVRDGTRGEYKSRLGNEGAQVHQSSTWDRGNVLVSTYGLWNGGVGWENVTIDLGLLLSNDGLYFREPVPNHIFIERGEDGAWDQGGLLMSQAFENIGEKTFIYYGHWDPRTGQNYEPRGGLGLVTLDKDRFSSLSVRNPEKEAAFITCALKVDEPSDLFFNATGLSEDAWVKVELLDELERPIPAYSGENAARLDSNGFRQHVSWQGNEGIEGSSKPVKIQATYQGEDKKAIKIHALYVSKRDNAK